MSKKRPIPVLLSDSDTEKAKKSRKTSKNANSGALDKFLTTPENKSKKTTIDNFFQKSTVKKSETPNKVDVDDFFTSSSAEPKSSPALKKKDAEKSSVALKSSQKKPAKFPVKVEVEKMDDSPSKLSSNSPQKPKSSPVKGKSIKMEESPSNTSSNSSKTTKTKQDSPSKRTPDKLDSKVLVPETPTTEMKSVLDSSVSSATEKKNTYFSFMNRDGPQKLGERVIPKGTPNCLSGKTFVFTGVLDYIERDDAQGVVEKCGGRVTKSISKKTTFLVTGRDSGESKLAKAKTCGVKTMSEDEFFELLESHSPKGETKDNEKNETTKDSSSTKPLTGSSVVKNRKAEKSSPPKKMKTETCSDIKSVKRKSDEKIDKDKMNPLTLSSHDLWVDKYRPKTRNNLIGHNGEKSPANKLFHWLSAWQTDFDKGLKEKAYNSAPPWGASASDDGKWSRAVLLSGPPGIGKTSAAMVICNELGYSFTEMNASDSRSKNLMKEQLGDSLKMSHLKDMATGSAKTLNTKKHALIMDEIDGMAGNEDRGGIQEIISMIKTSKIPVICICNDRQSQKIRSLSNYCFDLRFSRPRVEQIKATIMSISFKEGIKIPSDVLNEIIEASNHDIRQVINTVQMWSRENNYDVAIQAAPKDLRVGAFDVIRKVFQPDISGKNGCPVTMNEAMDNFFQDYSLVPLFVQENYLKINPRNSSGGSISHLESLARASHDMATGDIISHTIRKAGTGSWSLLPVEAIFSTVSPGYNLRGSLPGGPMGVSFPAWFGKYSTTSKSYRQLAQLSTHMRLSSESGSYTNSSLSLDLLHYFNSLMTTRLAEGDIEVSVKTLNDYNLLKDDYDAIVELTTWSNLQKSLVIDSKVKAAFTRAYNKSDHLLPYSTLQSTTASKKKTTVTFDIDGNEDEEEINEEDDDNDLSAFKTKTTTKKASTAGGKESTASKTSKGVAKKKVVKK